MQVPRGGARQQRVQGDAGQRRAVEADVEAGGEVELERERAEDEQRVEADVSVHGESAGRGVRVDVGAELQ